MDLARGGLRDARGGRGLALGDRAAAVRTLELPSWEAVKRVVASGAGIAAISRLAIELEVEAGRLAVLDVPLAAHTHHLGGDGATRAAEPARRAVLLLRAQLRGQRSGRRTRTCSAATPLVGRAGGAGAAHAPAARPHAARDRARPGRERQDRLAVEAAAGVVDDFRDGVFLVDLTPLRDPSGRAGDRAGAGVAGGRERRGSPAARRLLRRRQRRACRRGCARPRGAPRRVGAAVSISDEPCPARRRRACLRLPPLAPEDAVALFVDRALAVDAAFVDDGAVGALPAAGRPPARRSSLRSSAACVSTGRPAEPAGSTRRCRCSSAAAATPRRAEDVARCDRVERSAAGPAEPTAVRAPGGVRRRVHGRAASAVCSATPAALGALVDASLLRAAQDGGSQRSRCWGRSGSTPPSCWPGSGERARRRAAPRRMADRAGARGAVARTRPRGEAVARPPGARAGRASRRARARSRGGRRAARARARRRSRGVLDAACDRRRASAGWRRSCRTGRGSPCRCCGRARVRSPSGARPSATLERARPWATEAS